LDTRITEVAPGRPNVVAHLAGDGPTLLLNGHLDTVGVAGMTIDPFSGAERDGRIWGRGACDMKAGVACILSTAKALAGAAVRPNLVVALTADEEDESLGMARLVRDGIHADLAVVCEPTGLAVMPAHKGFLWMRATFKGRAAHGSRPDLGVDAIRHAARYLTMLESVQTELNAGEGHPLLGHGSFHAGTITGGSAASVYPEFCELVVERRTLPGEEREQVLGPFRATLEALGREEPELMAGLEVTLERPGTEVPGDSPLVTGLLRALSAHGVTPNVGGMTAWVDAAFLNEAGIPAVCFGPGSIEQAHTADEWVPIEEIRACARALADFSGSLATNGSGGGR
jgi:acetylornithine deacetylase